MRILILVFVGILAGACGKTNPSKKDLHPAPIGDGLGLVDSSQMTSQRQLVNEAIGRARAANKVVLIRATGAWCPPCVAWDIFLEKHHEDLKESFARYETLALDEVFYDRNIASDHLPIDTIWFPSYFAFNPSTGQWAMIPIEADSLAGMASFKATLKAFAAGEDLTSRYQRLSKEAFEKKVRLSSGTEAGNDAIDNHQAAAINTAMNRSAEETFALLKQMKDTIESQPELVRGTSYSHSFTTLHSLRAAVSRGTIDGAAGWELVSEDLNATNPPQADQYFEAMFMFYRSPLSHLVRASGLKEAAKACPAHVNALKDIKGMTPVRARALMLDCAQLATEAGITSKEDALNLANETVADDGFMAEAKPTYALYRLRISAKDLDGAAVQVDAIRTLQISKREQRLAKRDEVIAKDDAAIAKARAENAEPEIIADLEGAKAINVISFNNLPVLRDHEAATYAELAGLLRSGIEKPALSRAKNGVGEL